MADFVIAVHEIATDEFRHVSPEARLALHIAGTAGQAEIPWCYGPLRLRLHKAGNGQSSKARGGRSKGPADSTTTWRSNGRTIVANESGPRSGAEGAAEELKGRVKEAAGAVTGDESLKQEGAAQQDKAAAQRDVAAKEAEAEKARADARAAETEQRSHQRGPN